VPVNWDLTTAEASYIVADSGPALPRPPSGKLPRRQVRQRYERG
jgi:hypothetical protein